VHELLGETGSVSEEVLEAVAIYRGALELYRARDFERAAQRFEEAAEAFGGDDPPSLLMAERARRYAESPPPEGWDGSHVMTEK